VTRRALAAVVVLALAAALFSFKAAEKMPDFEVYWRAGARAAAAAPLYRVEDGHYVHKYLPAFAILAIPAGLLPLEVSKAAWFFIATALLFVLVAVSVQLMPERRKPTWFLVLMTVVLLAKFYGRELILGQVNVLLGAVLVAAVFMIRRGRESAAGFLMALAIVVKPYAIIFVPWLAARRSWRAISASAAGLLAVLLIPVTVYGFSGTIALHVDWWRTVRDSTAPNLLNADNVSLAAMYAKWFGPGDTAALLAVLTAGLLVTLAIVLFALRRPVIFPEALEAALLLTFIPLFSPQGWDYVFLIATPATMLIVNYFDRLPMAMRMISGAAVATIAFSIYDVMGRQAFGRFMALSIITVCYFAVIAGLATLRARQIA
jgi:arabinofuranan 3-O-arabinosyltransferase